MQRVFKYIFLIIVLGVLVVPKQIIVSQMVAMTCCIEKSEKKDCCTSHPKEKAPCHQDSNCEGNCKNCTVCAAYGMVFHLPKNVDHIVILESYAVSKMNFSYHSPDISDIFTKIWQPPKIA